MATNKNPEVEKVPVELIKPGQFVEFGGQWYTVIHIFPKLLKDAYKIKILDRSGTTHKISKFKGDLLTTIK